MLRRSSIRRELIRVAAYSRSQPIRSSARLRPGSSAGGIGLPFAAWAVVAEPAPVSLCVTDAARLRELGASQRATSSRLPAKYDARQACRWILPLAVLGTCPRANSATAY